MPTRALLSIGLILYYDSCLKHTCPALLWNARADAFASALRQASRRDVIVDVWGNCTPPSARTTVSGTRITVHSSVPAELEAAVIQYQGTLDKYRPMVRSIYKLLALGRADAEFTLFWDLDVDFFPPMVQRRPERVVQAWLGALSRMSRSNWVLAGRPDVASPVNGGMVLVRADASLYRDGLAILTRDPRPGLVYDWQLGWELNGPPVGNVPALDPVWVHPRGSAAIRANSWNYHGAMMDQGLWFYLTHVRHQKGGDLACLLPPHFDSEPSSSERPEFRYYHLYDKVFNKKCDEKWPYAVKNNEHMSLGKMIHYFREMSLQLEATLTHEQSDLERRLAQKCLAHSDKTSACSVKMWASLQRTDPEPRKKWEKALAMTSYDAEGMHLDINFPFRIESDVLNRSRLCAQLQIDHAEL
ncbi:hypothetical protein T492DRAFT_977801 [Pavlovales sp. CCMP2436]|nr:hypothetical protein T492DRAFT_977801 [Pavlovales sp. CCMP2436]